MYKPGTRRPHQQANGKREQVQKDSSSSRRGSKSNAGMCTTTTTTTTTTTSATATSVWTTDVAATNFSVAMLLIFSLLLYQYILLLDRRQHGRERETHTESDVYYACCYQLSSSSPILNQLKKGGLRTNASSDWLRRGSLILCTRTVAAAAIASLSFS